jgi:Tfp pilus assembly protein PilX
MACAGRSDRGVVLVMMLVLLAVMAMTAALASRLALTGVATSAGRQAHAQALAAAELALRYCEEQIGLASAVVPVQPAPDVDPEWPLRWQAADSWSGPVPLASPVPAALAWANAAVPADAPVPQCLIEAMVLPRSRGADDRLGVWLVTARGFSPGHAPGGRGAEVWLQSVVQK